jgi:hypothetical protein
LEDDGQKDEKERLFPTQLEGLQIDSTNWPKLLFFIFIFWNSRAICTFEGSNSRILILCCTKYGQLDFLVICVGTNPKVIQRTTHYAAEDQEFRIPNLLSLLVARWWSSGRVFFHMVHSDFSNGLSSCPRGRELDSQLLV